MEFVNVTDTAATVELNELGKALALAQGQIRNALKDADNPFFRSRYADLSSVWDACREQLSKNGLSVVQQVVGKGDDVGVKTTLLHSSGQWMCSTVYTTLYEYTNDKGKLMKPGPQQAGSAVTYLRRYSLAAVAGVAPGDDDDGEAAHGRSKPAKDYVNASKVPGKVEDAMSTLVQQDRITDLALELGLDKALYRKDWIGPYMTAGGKKAESSEELTEVQAVNLIARMEAATKRNDEKHQKMEAEAAANLAHIAGQMAQPGLKLPPKTKAPYKAPEEPKKNGIPKVGPTHPEFVKALSTNFEDDEAAEEWLTSLFSLDGNRVYVKDLGQEQRETAYTLMSVFGTDKYDSMLTTARATGRLARIS